MDMTLIRKCFFNKKSKKEFFIQKTYFKKNKTNYTTEEGFFKEFGLLLVLFLIRHLLLFLNIQ